MSVHNGAANLEHLPRARLRLTSEWVNYFLETSVTRLLRKWRPITVRSVA